MTSALQAIVFDFDGVIADSEPLHLRAFQKTLQEQGLELSTRDYYTHYLGYDDKGLFEALARDRSVSMSDGQVASLVARKATALQELLRDERVLFPGAAEFIRAAADEVPIAIASGALRHEILDILEEAGLSGLFATVVAAGDTLHSKPSPAPYRLAFEQLERSAGHLDARRCVAIEDSHWGIESARGAGLRCVAVATSYSREELRGAEFVVDNLGQLTVSMLDRLCTQPRSESVGGGSDAQESR
ncbi:MAG: HAD family phosphatase [Vicinamibacterales bacterium]